MNWEGNTQFLDMSRTVCCGSLHRSRKTTKVLQSTVILDRSKITLNHINRLMVSFLVNHMVINLIKCMDALLFVKIAIESF